MTPLLTAPGNLLIAGEYMVLEPGGLGIAVAADVRVTISTETAERLEIHGRMGDTVARWPATGESPGLLDAVVQEARTGGPLPAARIAVDSTPFFEGRKLGFGSSAAVAVALAAALLRLRGGGPPDRATVFERALAAHRAFQGGGSGYDVAASVHGGAGLFRGGEAPRWVSAEAGWLAGARLFRGPAPVRTPGATRRYRAWKEAEPELFRRHLEHSNELVRSLLDARTPAEARELLDRVSRLGVELGERIGVSARIDPPAGTDTGRWLWKALGAGNEVGLLLPRDRDVPPPEGSRPLAIAPEGLRWL